MFICVLMWHCGLFLYMVMFVGLSRGHEFILENSIIHWVVFSHEKIILHTTTVYNYAPLLILKSIKPSQYSHKVHKKCLLNSENWRNRHSWKTTLYGKPLLICHQAYCNQSVNIGNNLPSYLPPVWASKRFVAIASISSIKMMAGAFSLARRNTSRTIRGPSPRYFCTNSDPTTRMNAAVANNNKKQAE